MASWDISAWMVTRFVFYFFMIQGCVHEVLEKQNEREIVIGLLYSLLLVSLLFVYTRRWDKWTDREGTLKAQMQM